MSKMDKLNEEGEEVLAVLSPADYWEWRTTVEELDHSDTKLVNMNLKLKLMETQQRMLSMEMALFRNQVSDATETKELAMQEYKKFKEKLEEIYEISLSDCVIRDTFEVIKTPQGGAENGTN